MIFAILTLLSALSLAGVAGWFSIIGITAIYAGAPWHALIMGVVLEAGKLVTTSWLYRNWEFSNWTLKLPLIVFTLTLMLSTSIGVYGFLSKAHLEQGAGTIDNSSKIERLNQQIEREKSVIADDEKVIGQLDAAINSYIGKDRTDKSVSVRKSQAPQRKQLREDIDSSQKRIDGFSEEKFKLESEVRKLQLDVGPIRYIAELMYGADGNADKKIESAVRIFTLIIVSTLDPLAVILLIAANHTLLRRQNEKEIPTSKEDDSRGEGDKIELSPDDVLPSQEEELHSLSELGEVEGTTVVDTQAHQGSDIRQDFDGEEVSMAPILEPILPESFQPTWPKIPEQEPMMPATIHENIINEIEAQDIGSDALREYVGYKAGAHFVPKMVTEKENIEPPKNNLPKALSWLNEFKGK